MRTETFASLLGLAALAGDALAGSMSLNVENTSANLSYTGASWTTFASTVYSGGSVTFATGPGASVAYTAPVGAVGLSILTTFSPGSARGQVSIDGRAPQSMDPTRTPYGYQKIGFASDNLDPTVPHTITLAWDPLSDASAHLDLDAFVVTRLDAAGLASLTASNTSVASTTTSSTGLAVAGEAASYGGSNVGAIAGGVVGGVLALVALGLGAWCLRRRAQNRAEHRRSKAEIDRPLSPRLRAQPYEMTSAAFAPIGHSYAPVPSHSSSQLGHGDVSTSIRPATSPLDRPLSSGMHSSESRTGLEYLQPGSAPSQVSDEYGREWLARNGAPLDPDPHTPVALANPDPASPVDSSSSPTTSAAPSGFHVLAGTRKAAEYEFAAAQREDDEVAPPAYPGQAGPSQSASVS